MKSFFAYLVVVCFVVSILLSFIYVFSVTVDPTLYESVSLSWSASVITPSTVGNPLVRFSWVSSIIQPMKVESLDVNAGWNANIVPPKRLEGVSVGFRWWSWILNNTGLYSNGALVTYPWVNCSYLVREGFVVVPAVVGANVSGYVDINVSNSTLLAYLWKDPTSALITLDGSTTPLTYYVYDVNTSYIVYRVVLNNVSDGPHIIWVYAGGDFTGVGLPGVPFEIKYSGTPLYNYTVLVDSTYQFFDGSGNTLPVYSENGVTYVRLPVVNNGTTVIYGRLSPNITYASPADISAWYDDLETFTGWVNYSLGHLYWSSTYKYAGNYGIVKNDNNDPNGGYKQLPITLGSKPFVLEAEIERINTLGGAVDRIGVINGTGYGYGFAFDNGASYLEIDKRSAYTATLLGTVTSTKPSGWYLARMYWFPNGTIMVEIVQNGNIIKSLKATDTAYSSFDHVYIFGGYEYAVDNIRIRYVSDIGDLIAQAQSISEIPLLYDVVGTAVEQRPASCLVTSSTTSTTTTRTFQGGYIPPPTTKPVVTWVEPPPYVTTTGNSLREQISNAIVYLLHRPEVLFIIIIMFIGFILIMAGSRRRY